MREQTWYVSGFLIRAVTGVILIDGDGPYLFLRASSCPECHLIGVKVLSGPSEILKLSSLAWKLATCLLEHRGIIIGSETLRFVS